MTEAHYGPGDVCPTSGIWAATSREKADIALSKGDRFPPLEVQGARWVLVQPTVAATEAIGMVDAAGYVNAVEGLYRTAKAVVALGDRGPAARSGRARRELAIAIARYEEAERLEEQALDAEPSSPPADATDEDERE